VGHDGRTKGIMEIALGPIRKDLVYDFLRGFKNVDEMEIKASA
jgi:hypothetical protein